MFYPRISPGKRQREKNIPKIVGVSSGAAAEKRKRFSSSVVQNNIAHLFLYFLGVFSEKCSPADCELRKSVGEVPTRRRKQSQTKNGGGKRKGLQIFAGLLRSVRWPGKPPKTKTTTGWCFCSHPSYLEEPSVVLNKIRAAE